MRCRWAAKAPAPQARAEAAEPTQGAKPVSADAPQPQATKAEAHIAQAEKAVTATAQTAADAGGDFGRIPADKRKHD